MRHPKALLTVLSIAVSLVLLEAAARVVVWRRTPPGMVFDDELIYTFEPRSRVGGMVLDNLGCVGDDLAPGRTGAFRVLLLGGSTSFSQVYVDAVRARLVEGLGRPDVEVASCGRPRYTSYSNRVQLERLADRYRPDAVAVYLGINDNIYNSFPWLDDVPDVGYLNWRDRRSSVAFELLRYHLVSKRLRSVPDFPAELRSVPRLGANLEAIVATSRRVGARPVLATFAIALPTADRELERRVRADEPRMEHFWGRVDSTVRGVEAHNRVIREVATAAGVPLAEVASQIPADGDHFVDICHLTARGSRILGRTIAGGVLEACPTSDPSGSRSR